MQRAPIEVDTISAQEQLITVPIHSGLPNLANPLLVAWVVEKLVLAHYLEVTYRKGDAAV